MSALTGRPSSSVRERGEGKALLTNAAKPQPKGPRDPHKYDWMPPDPPRVPRRSTVQLTNLQVAACLLGCIALLGGLYGVALEVLSVVRIVGWMIWRPAP